MLLVVVVLLLLLPEALEAERRRPVRDEDALQEGDDLHLREVVHDVPDLLKAAGGKEDLAPEGHDGGSEERQRQEGVVADDAVPEEEHLVEVEVSDKGPRDPREGDLERGAPDGREVPEDLGLDLLEDVLKGAAEHREGGGGPGRGSLLRPRGAASCCCCCCAAAGGAAKAWRRHQWRQYMARKTRKTSAGSP